MVHVTQNSVEHLLGVTSSGLGLLEYVCGRLVCIKKQGLNAIWWSLDIILQALKNLWKVLGKILQLDFHFKNVNCDSDVENELE